MRAAVGREGGREDPTEGADLSVGDRRVGRGATILGAGLAAETG